MRRKPNSAFRLFYVPPALLIFFYSFFPPQPPASSAPAKKASSGQKDTEGRGGEDGEAKVRGRREGANGKGEKWRAWVDGGGGEDVPFL